MVVQGHGVTTYRWGQFVGKRGDSPQHIQNEYDMNRFLNELGVPVPQAQMQDGLMLTQMEEGNEMGRANQQDIQQLSRDFVPLTLRLRTGTCSER